MGTEAVVASGAERTHGPLPKGERARVGSLGRVLQGERAGPLGGEICFSMHALPPFLVFRVHNYKNYPKRIPSILGRSQSSARINGEESGGVGGVHSCHAWP